MLNGPLVGQAVIALLISKMEIHIRRWLANQALHSCGSLIMMGSSKNLHDDGFLGVHRACRVCCENTSRASHISGMNIDRPLTLCSHRESWLQQLLVLCIVHREKTDVNKDKKENRPGNASTQRKQMSDPCHATLIRHTLCHYMNSKTRGSLEQPTRTWPAEPLPSAAAETMFQWVPALPWGVGARPRNPCSSLRDPASWLPRFHSMLWTLGLTSVPRPYSFVPFYKHLSVWPLSCVCVDSALCYRCYITSRGS